MLVRPDPLRAAFLVCAFAGRAESHAAHRRLVREQAARRGGRELPLHGDTLVLAFELGSAAAACAVAIQRAVQGRARIGVHSGTALRHEGSVIGRVVAHARRLAEAAQPGEILLSPLAAGEAGAATEPVAVTLTGLPARLPARRLLWDSSSAHPRRSRFLRGGREVAAKMPLRCAASA